MKLPNYQRAVVAREKITEYLLSLSHEDGRTKARFFLRFGFSPASWEILADALRRHAADHDVARVVETDRGIRYVVEGILQSPDGRRPAVRSVWFIDSGAVAPRLVTAYPLPRRRS